MCSPIILFPSYDRDKTDYKCGHQILLCTVVLGEEEWRHLQTGALSEGKVLLLSIEHWPGEREEYRVQH